MGLFWKSKTRIIAKFHSTYLVIGCHRGEGKTSSYSRINTVKLISSASNEEVTLGNSVDLDECQQVFEFVVLMLLRIFAGYAVANLTSL